jgi:hypothetical protein
MCDMSAEIDFGGHKGVRPGNLEWPPCPSATVEHLEVLDRAGLLFNEPPDTAEVPFNQSSDVS